MKVTIKDYQAIVNAELNFNNGLTAIVGSTNSGKSSIIRAIKGAVYNQGGTGFINYDADESSVIIEDNGHVIEWNKSKKGGGKYVLDGREITKIGVTQNEEVAALLNMGAIEVGKDKVNLNFWEQQERAFLMDKTPGQLFDFISQSKEQEVITSYSEDNKKQLSENKKLVDMFNTQIDIYKTELDKDRVELELIKPIASIDIETMLALNGFIEESNKAVNTIYKIDDDLNFLMEDYYVSKHKANYNLDRELFTNFFELEKEVNTLLTNLEKTNNYIDTYTTHLTNLKTQQETKQQELEQLSKRVEQYNELQTKITDLQTSLSNVLTNKDKYDKIVTSIDLNEITTKQIKETLNRLTKELATIEVCPLCSTPLNNGVHVHTQE